MQGEQIEPRQSDRPPSEAASHATDPVRIGLVDSFMFTRECLIEALAAAGHGFAVTAYDTVANLIASGGRAFDVILYYYHQQTPSGVADAIGEVGSFQQEFARAPVLLLADAPMEFAPHAVRAALKSGVRGILSTRTFEMKTVAAAIRVVLAGGIFAPVDVLLADEPPVAPVHDDALPTAGLLTPRQATVLSLLQQGKANKVIACELGMSENTVKVHIRNIMRKIGATNRTQALYKLQHLVGSPALAAATDL